LFSKLDRDVECFEKVPCVFEGFGGGWGGIVLSFFENGFSYFFPIGKFRLELLVVALEASLGSEELFLNGFEGFLFGVL
jgi:hypothetical protein